MIRLLLLAGTAEARQLATVLRQEARISAMASLAGSTRTPQPLDLPTRTGGFGGREAFADWLRDEGIDAVLDATHPFADRISWRTHEVCRDLSVPYMQVLRPAWTPGPDDDWVFLNAEAEAAKVIPEGSVVFLATGPATLDWFANLEGRRVYCRRIETPCHPFPFEGGEYLVQRGPFHVNGEMALYHDLGVDWLVTKNSGGSSSRAKLDAARGLGIRVAMLRRPRQPEGPKVSTVSAAISWVRQLP